MCGHPGIYGPTCWLRAVLPAFALIPGRTNSVVAFGPRLLLLSPVPLLGEQVLHRRQAEGASELRELEQPGEIRPFEVMMHDRERFAELPGDALGRHAGLLHEVIEPQGELPRAR